MLVGSLFIARYNVLNEHVAVGVTNFKVISAYVDLLYILWIRVVVRGTAGCGISHKSMNTELHSFIRLFIRSFIHSFIHSFIYSLD